MERKVITLNVGGYRYQATAATLVAVTGGFLWKLGSAQSARTPAGDYFIDRNGKVRSFVLCG